MDTYLLDWLNLLLRWLHVIVGIAWIGASFYFVWLDNHLQPPQAAELKARGVSGELWAVHGGGFYNPQKYLVAPPELPQRLHWFYWESYWTWMSGFALFVTVYLLNAESYLIDRRVMDWSPGWAVVAALAFLPLGWLVYDQLCRHLGRGADGSVGHDGRVLSLLALFIGAATWLACQLFAGRAAFVVVGAMLATLMSANVLFWIIPGQRQVIADLRAGRAVNPVHGQRAKQRSVHNTYLTLPVLLAMLSPHYSMLHSGPWNWLVLLGLMAVGALVRQYFVLRHQGVKHLGLLLTVGLLLGSLVWALRPTPQPLAQAPTPQAVPSFVEVQAIVNARCVVCHNAQVTQKNIRLDHADFIVAQAPLIRQQVNLLRLMPLNNATGITEVERAQLGAWVLAGAPRH